MKRFIRVLVFVFAVTSGGGSAMAQSAITTLPQALRHVYNENPTLQASRFGLKATHELHPQALAGWHPSINAEASVTSTDIDSGNFTQGTGATTKGMSISAEQPLFRGWRTSSEISHAKNRIKAGYSRLRQTEQEMFLRTVGAYMTVVRDRMILGYQQANKDALQKQRDSLRARYEAGDVTLTDVRRAEARLQEALAGHIRAQGALRASEAVFEEIIGLPPSNRLSLPAADFAFPDSMAAMVELARRNNPALFVPRYEHRAAQDDIGIAESDLYPHLSAFASHIKEYDPQPGIVDESETSAIGLRARINLYEGGKTVSRVREAKNRANQRYIEIIEAERAVVSDLIGSWSRLQSSISEVEAREMEVSAGIFATEGVREEARLGERSTVETLDAERDLLEAREGLAGARRDMVVAAYELAAALGLLLPEHMGMEDIAYDPGPHYRSISHRYFSMDEN